MSLKTINRFTASRGEAADTFSRVIVTNLFIGTAALLTLTIWNLKLAPAFAAGFTLGAVNVALYMAIAKRAVNFDAETAGRYVMSRYYMRFLLTASAIVVLALYIKLNPWMLLLGLSLSLFSAAGTLFVSLLKDKN